MKKIKFIMITMVFVPSILLFGQSIVIGTGASIVVPSGADICAGEYGNITGNLIGEGTQCGFAILPTGFLGDVNDDGLCNSTDALIILSYDVGLTIPPDFLARILAGYGDVNSDTFTNSTDALILLSFDVGIPVPFPVCDPFAPGPAVTVSKGSTKNIDN